VNLADLLAPTAAGLRMALTLLAVMVLLSGIRSAPGRTHPLAFHANRRAWTLIALAALIRSLPRAATLLSPGSVSQLLDRLTEIVSTGLAIAAFMLLLAARARVRGFAERCVRRSMFANFALVAGFIALAFV
jgi:hypothetical protein